MILISTYDWCIHLEKDKNQVNATEMWCYEGFGIV